MVVFTLTLVRHGETGANKENVIQGQLDVPLSETGLKQAILLGIRLQNQCYTHIFSSDLIRAKQTAQKIVEKNRYIKCSVIQDPKLRERKFGELEGKTFSELKRLARRANQSVSSFTPAEAETVQQVRQRGLLFFQELCHQLLKAGNNGNSNDNDTKFEPSHMSAMGVKRRRQSSLCTEDGESSKNDKSADTSSNELEVHRIKRDKTDALPSIRVEVAADDDPAEKHTVISKNGRFFQEDNSARLQTKKEIVEQLCVYVPSRCKHRCCKSSENGGGVSTFEKPSIPASSLHFTESVTQMKCNYQCANFMDNECPNVSLLPLIEHRLSRISSADSDRKASIDSSNDDCDSVPRPIANVLVVSHGGLLREMMRHFIDNLGCSLPGGKGQALRLSPNTGLSKFTVSISDLNEKPKIICLLIHDKDHLTENGMNSINSSVL